MKTREELLKMADEFLDYAKAVGDGVDGLDTRDERVQSAAPWVIAHAQFASACVALAKEMREAENAPTYEQMTEVVKALQLLEPR